MPDNPEHSLRTTRNGWPIVVLGCGIAATLLWVGFLGWLLVESMGLAL